MIKPGPRNLLTDVPGLLVGNAEDGDVRTGVTVVRPEGGPVVAAVDVRGGASGTRNTATLETSDIARGVHGIVLSGGSEFGLAAADGAVEWLSGHGIGLDLAPRPIPVVAGAILFDLNMAAGRTGTAKAPIAGWAARRAARRAATSRSARRARVTALRPASSRADWEAPRPWTRSGLMVGALVAVNSVGAVTMPEFSRLLGLAVRARGGIRRARAARGQAGRRRSRAVPGAPRSAPTRRSR